MRNLARASGLMVGTGVGVLPHLFLVFLVTNITDPGTAVIVLCGGCLIPLISLVMPGIGYSIVYTRFHVPRERRGALGGALSSILVQLIAGLIWFVVVAFFQDYMMDTVIGQEILRPWSVDPEYGDEYLDFLGGVYMSVIIFTLVMALFGALLSAFSGSLGAKLFSKVETKNRVLSQA